jgi:glyoxylase-like metal-dependent hydrolase (beta-lactamase superfamily II)
MQPFFPRARYLVAAQEWAPHERGETIPGVPTREAVIEPLAGHHTAFDDGEEVFPGVHALVTPGHSPGHTSFIVTTDAGRLIMFGDAFRVPAQIQHPDWPSRPDVDGGRARGPSAAGLGTPAARDDRPWLPLRRPGLRACRARRRRHTGLEPDPRSSAAAHPASPAP